MISENFSDIELIPILESIKFEEMSDERYFSSEFSEYISNSRLSLINPSQGGSVEKYLQGINGIYSDSIVLGSAIHELILQNDEFELIEDVDRPTAKMGAMADELYKIYKTGKPVKDSDVIDASNKIEYYKGKMNSDKIQNVFDKCKNYWDGMSVYKGNKIPIYLDEKSREKVHKCIESVSNCKKIQSLLHPDNFLEEPISLNEIALFIDIKAKYKDKECILKIKGKLDNCTISDNNVVLNDLKTTGHYLDKFEESFVKYHYNRQMALYLWMLKLYAQKYHNITNISSLSTNMLLISTIPNYYSGVYKVSKNQIAEGFKELIELLKRVAAINLC